MKKITLSALVAILSFILFVAIEIIEIPLTFIYQMYLGRWKIVLTQVPHVLRKYWPSMFDANGLRHNNEYILSLNVRDFMLTKSVHEQAEYANAFCVKQIALWDKSEYGLPFDAECISVVEIGNAAYLSLYAKDGKLKAAANKWLRDATDYYSNFK